MRVHGPIKLVRSDNVAQQSQYRNYKDSLRSDFSQVCGYCAKHEHHCTKWFEIDHFVPLDIDKDRETDYTNLVFACFTCNRKKGKKWPTGDKTLPHNGQIGLIDPVTQEFDEHIERLNTGEIVGKTELGNYICNDIFKFNTRLMKEIWLYSQLYSEHKSLEKMIEIKGDKISKSKLLKYARANIALKKLWEKFRVCGE